MLNKFKLKRWFSISLVTFSAMVSLAACQQANSLNELSKDVNFATEQTKPNVVLFLTDDQGWGDLSFNGNTILDTPRIDSIAKSGISLNRFYVNPVCSPTRAAVLTGRHSLRTGVFSVTRGGEKMRSEEITLAEMFKQESYVTGLFGKWHNGAQYPHDPLGQGFDEYLGIIDGHQTLYFDAELMKNGKPFQTKGYIADVTTDAAIDFIKQADKNGKPFFAYVPFNTPHSPFELPKKYFDKYKNKGLSDLDASVYGMMENVDDNVGRVLDTLIGLGIQDDTIVLFMSDNGPAFPNKQARFNGGLKGSKGQLDEGGVRSPLFVQWPGKIYGGRKINTIAQHLDIAPSLMSLIGGEMPQDRVIDGADISKLWLDENADEIWPDRTLFLHHFRNTQREQQKAVLPNPGSVRTQNWLATFERNGDWHLYDMRNDELQENELSEKYPEVLSKLKHQYFEFYEDITAKPIKTLPIEIGHSGHEEVVMAAHEAAIQGQGIDYAHKAGWAHDWIEVSGDVINAELKWPVKAVSSGKYQIDLKYASPEGSSNLGLDLTFVSLQKQLNVSLAKFTPEIDHGNRLYYTGEAPDLTWNYVSLGAFYVPTQQGEIKISVDDLTKNRGTQKVLIKGIRVTKL
ncbi:arylsulfatase [Catenovulum sediminis]|uniref:Arylsulfatase n=1 Tax=Catenovulum sediminis TaxID=1740262 RepID=A0ABV1RCD3_9ALTE